MHRKLLAFAAIVAIALLPAAGFVSAQDTTAHLAPPRATAWAVPIKTAGAPNLHRVAATLFRSAQPDATGFQTLAKDFGIKTVVSLRAFHSDDALLKETGIALVSIPIHTWHIETEDVVLALTTIRRAEASGGVLVHCQHGADRTGLISALYRVLYQGWSKAAALDEMMNGGFGYHTICGNIPHYLRTVDAAALKLMVEQAAK